MAFSARGRVGSMFRPASGSRLACRASIFTAPFRSSIRSVDGVVRNSRSTWRIHPPPTLSSPATSSRWREVSSALPPPAAASTYSISFALAPGFSTAAGTAVRSTVSIGDAV